MKQKDAADRDPYAEVERLERRQQELQRLSEKQAARNHRRRELLESLDRASGRRRRWLVALVVLLLVGGIAGYIYLKVQVRPDLRVRRVVHRPVTSHLLVTSDPDGAEVTLDGKRVGRTPLFRAAPQGRDQHEVRLQAPGFVPAIRTVEVSQLAGRHWHKVLHPLPGGAR
jgi:hypothetical protein